MLDLSDRKIVAEINFSDSHTEYNKSAPIAAWKCNFPSVKEEILTDRPANRVIREVTLAIR